MTTPRRFLFLLASSRLDGNSEQLARRAARHLPAGAETRWLRLEDHSLPPFEDTRHSKGYSAPEGEAALLAEATLWATDLVVVTPVYWYSLPARAKLYFDHWSGWMRVPSLALRDTLVGRRMWAVITDAGSAEEGSSDLIEAMLQRTAAYMGMTWMGALMGHANQPGEIAKDALAMAAAESYFQKPSPHV